MTTPTTKRDPGRVRGHCPMGCGETLFVASGGWLTCSWIKCPNPTAVADLLEHREVEHIVVLKDESFDVQHPLRERLNGDLFRCDVHQRIAALDGPPRQPGRYRVAARPDTWSWTELPNAEATGDAELQRQVDALTDQLEESEMQRAAAEAETTEGQ